MKGDKCLSCKSQPLRFLFVNLFFHCLGFGSTIGTQRNGLSPRSAFLHRSMGHDRFQKRSKKVLGIIMMRPSEQNLTADGVTVLAPVSSVDKAVLKSLNISVPSNALNHSQGSQQTSQDMTNQTTGFKNDFNSQENKTNLPQSNQFGLSDPTSSTNPSDTSASVESHTTSGVSVVPENSLKDSTIPKTIDITPVNASTDHLANSKKPETQNQKQELTKNETTIKENAEANKIPTGILLDPKQRNASTTNETESQSSAKQKNALVNVSSDNLKDSKKPETQRQKQELFKDETSTNQITEANKTLTGNLLDQKQGNASTINENQSQSNGNQTKPVDDWQYLSSNSQLVSNMIPATLTLMVSPTLTLILSMITLI